MHSYNCFIFDFDGTLADSRLNITNSFNYALKVHKFKLISPKLIYPLIGKLDIEETFKKFYPGLSQKKLKRLINSFRIYQKRNAHKEITLYDGVLETIKTLHARKKQLAIVTTKHINQIEHILRVFKIYDYFDVIFGRGTMEFAKPQRECFDYVFQHLKIPVSKDNFLMIGDSNVDCEFSHNSQITMMGVSWGVDSPTALKEAGAKDIINNISDLLRFI